MIVPGAGASVVAEDSDCEWYGDIEHDVSNCFVDWIRCDVVESEVLDLVDVCVWV